MKKLYAIPGLIAGIVFLIVAFVFVQRSSEASKQFQEEKLKVVEILNFNERIMSFRDWVFSEKAWLEKKEKFDAVIIEADKHYEEALTNGYYLLIAALSLVIITTIIYARKRIYFGLTMALCFVGVALIAEGVMNPMLEMSAFKDDMTFKIYVKPSDIPFYNNIVDYMQKSEDISDFMRWIPVRGDEWADKAGGFFHDGKEFLEENADKEFGKDQVFEGRTYFYHQNKSIADVITLLWENENKPVAAVIGTFSVIVPFIKLVFTLVILILPIHGAKRLRKFLSFIAKWSMADVFVVGAFIAYLSFANMSPGVEMDADVLFGLYFFLGYVFISMILGYLLDKSIQEKLKRKHKGETAAITH